MVHKKQNKLPTAAAEAPASKAFLVSSILLAPPDAISGTLISLAMLDIKNGHIH